MQVWDSGEQDWYGCSVLTVNPEQSKAKVHYIGWSSCYDEWVSRSRVRAWTAATEPDCAAADEMYTAADGETPTSIAVKLKLDASTIVQLNRCQGARS